MRSDCLKVDACYQGCKANAARKVVQGLHPLSAAAHEPWRDRDQKDAFLQLASGGYTGRTDGQYAVMGHGALRQDLRPPTCPCLPCCQMSLCTTVLLGIPKAQAWRHVVSSTTLCTMQASSVRTHSVVVAQNAKVSMNLHSCLCERQDSARRGDTYYGATACHADQARLTLSASSRPRR